MTKHYLILLIAIGMGVCPLFAEGGSTRHVVECGTWMELKATPAEDYHFVRWSDNNRDSIRQIQVEEDAHYIAFFAANCEEYANWPIVCKYDWLLMLDVEAIQRMGYYVLPEQVWWYRIVGKPDDMHKDIFPLDDQFICTGYYLKIDYHSQTASDYYCVADVSDTKGMLCDGLMRSEIVHLSSTEHHPSLYISPGRIRQGESVTIYGLNPAETYEISLYSIVGQWIGQYSVRDADTFTISEELTAGCYQVLVHSASIRQTLRFIVID